MSVVPQKYALPCAVQDGRHTPFPVHTLPDRHVWKLPHERQELPP